MVPATPRKSLNSTLNTYVLPSFHNIVFSVKNVLTKEAPMMDLAHQV